MRKKILSRSLILSLSLIVFSCATVPNVPICKEINPDKGWCSYTTQKGGFFVDDARPYQFNPKEFDSQRNPIKYSWWEYKPYMMALPPHSWQKLKEYIIKKCRKSKDCQDGVGQWFDEFERKGK